MSAQVLFERHDRVGLITLNRPEKLNAFADRMRDELGEVTRAAMEDDAVGALELALTAEMLSAEEALRLGLFNRVVDDERLINETLSRAARLAAKPPLAVALTKRALRQSLVSTLPEALDRERVNQMRLFRSAEARAAIHAFLEKRASAHRNAT